MKRVQYTKFTGDLASEIDLENLLKALSDYLLDSGYYDPFTRFRDLDHTLDDLREALRRVLQDNRGLARLRLSSLDPVEMDEDLWALLADEPRLMPHLHISLQAGDDMVLKRMKRRHSRADAG